MTAARHEQGRPSGDSMDSMTLAQKRAVTFEEFWLIFQRHHRVEPNTVQSYFSMWVNHLRPYLRTFHIALLDATNAIKYFTVLADAGETVNTRKSCRSVLSAMLGLAIRMGYRTDNPVQGLNVGKQAANKTIKVINEIVFWELCVRLPLETQRLFAEYIISTGKRFCEAISFQEGDLDYKTGMLTVCRSTVEVSRWVNTPRYTEEEMQEGGKNMFVSPVTGNLVTHCKLSTDVKHRAGAGPASRPTGITGRRTGSRRWRARAR